MIHEELTIIFKDGGDYDDDFGGTYKTVYENASFKISNQHMILELHRKGDDDNEYVEGYVFDLKLIKSYKSK